MQFFDHRFNACAGGHIAALDDDGPVLALHAAMIQAEAGGGVNPMPAGEVLAPLAFGLGLLPIVPFTNVPGVDLDDQSKGFFLEGSLTGANQRQSRMISAVHGGELDDGAISLALSLPGQGSPA